MPRSDFRPLHHSECWELCETCGERLDVCGVEECVNPECAEYLAVTNSLETEHPLAHARDTRRYLGSDEFDDSEVA